MPLPLNAQPSVRLTATAAVTSLFCPWPTWRTRCQPAAGGAAAGAEHPAAPSTVAVRPAAASPRRHAVLPRMRPSGSLVSGRRSGSPTKDFRDPPLVARTEATKA
jgi:hypothetical protein